MQPFQCDLQQQLQEPHRTTKTGTTNRCKHIGGTIRAWNDPICTRRTDEVPFFASCSHFTRKNTRLRTSASSPKHYPCNIHAAITLRSCNRRFKNPIELRTQEQPLVTKKIGGTIKGPQPQQRGGTFIRRLQPLYTENTRFLLLLPDQNTHATFMLCIRSFKNRIELRTQEQPLVGKNIGGTIRAWNDPSRTDEVPFFAGCSYFCTEKHKVSCLVFLPKTGPMQHSFSHSNAIMQPEIQEPHRTTHTGTTTCCKTHRTNNETTQPDPAAPAAQTRYLSSPVAATLHGKHKFSCSRFLPKILPCITHAAIPMRSATTASRTV